MPDTQYDVGDTVWLLFWRAFPMPGQPNNGTWDTVSASVIGVGRSGRVCVEVYNQGVATSDAASPTSTLRYVPADRVFPSSTLAAEAARTRPAPV